MNYARIVLCHGHSDMRKAEIVAEFDPVVLAGLGIECEICASEVFCLFAENAGDPGALDSQRDGTGIHDNFAIDAGLFHYPAGRVEGLPT